MKHHALLLTSLTAICLTLTSCETQQHLTTDLTGLTKITGVKEVTAQTYQHPDATQLNITVMLDTTDNPAETQIRDMVTAIANQQPEENLIQLTVTDENNTPFNIATQISKICPEKILGEGRRHGQQSLS